MAVLLIGISGCNKNSKDADGDTCVTEKDTIYGSKKCYYSSGKLKSKFSFRITMSEREVAYGHKETYYPSGSLHLKIPFGEYGEISGIVYEYYETGEVLDQTPYYDNKFRGRSTKYAKTGEVLEQNLSHNKDGVKRTFYSSGALESETPYKDGQKDGIKKDYFKKNGRVQFKTPYKNGNVHGTIYRYNSNGDTMSSTPYENGIQLRDSQWH